MRNYSVNEVGSYISKGYWAEFGQTAPKLSETITVNLSSLTPENQWLARVALAAWSEVGFTFIETSPSYADLLLTDDASGAQTSWTRPYGLPTANVGPDFTHYYGSHVGSYTYQSWLHEIGHALGLGHTGNYNGIGTYGVDNDFANDSWQMSVMSYFSQDDNTSIDADFAYVLTPMPGDIAAVEKLYPGMKSDANTGDTTYFWNSNATGFYGYIMQIIYNVFGRNPVTLTLIDRGGRDKLDFSRDAYGVDIDLTPGAASTAFGVTGSIVIERKTLIENVIGSYHDDKLAGNWAGNFISGRGGDDVILGRDGNDLLLGGDGNDRIGGGNGNDRLRGGAGNDKLSGDAGNDRLRGEAGRDRVEGKKGNDELHGNNGSDKLIGGSGNDKLYGGNHSDVLIGDSGRDRVDGGKHDDKLEGGGGHDTLRGGNGDDLLYGGNHNDILIGGGGSDRLFGGKHDDQLRGYSGNDTLAGQKGDDRVLGGDGNDRIISESGIDRVTGGAGADEFVFKGGMQIITDFRDDLDELLIDRGALGYGGLSKSQVISRAEVDDGDTIIDLGNGDKIKLLGVDNPNDLYDDLIFI
ncbi:M10 family metallopeptidase [Paracoccus sediminicola]|uniref:M10 family metallopeptidase n=1 Tax=Paracoccus sediminicola TaxID=3017783 RepID=UPI0022F13035|nr:M10 family metallopeptidase [Paracoccus sediminicola]WBU55502.1 M10 family metallopeptidase [Paracoccus sediminicola]